MAISRNTSIKCLAAMALLTTAGTSAAEGIQRRHYVMKKLMPCGTVTAIAPAGRYVWFGGWSLRPGEEHGLARYDKRARKWQLFLESEGVIADEINTLAVDGEYLWIGSNTDWLWNRGPHRYNPKDHTNKRFDKAEGGLPYWRVRDVAVLDDALWVATMGGVARYDKKAQTWRTYSMETGDLASNFTICIRADEQNVWLGSYSGLEVYDRKTGRWKLFDSKNSVFPSAVQDIAADKDKVWFLSPPAIITYSRRSRQFSEWPVYHEPARQSTLRSIEVTDDAVFLGSESGLHVWDKQTGAWKTYDSRNGLISDYVHTLAVGSDYAWCAADSGRGISRFDRQRGRWGSFRYRERSPSNHIYSLVSDGSHLYVGTLGSGLWKYDIRRDHWQDLNLLYKYGSHNFVYLGEKSPAKFSDIKQMVPQEGRIWMATNHGLCVHDPETEEDFEVLSPKSFPMLCLAPFAGKWLCGGRRDGLRTFDPKTGTWEDIGKKTGMEKRVVAVQPDLDAVWITDGREACRLVPETGERDRIKGVPERGIRSLLLHKGKLWIGTAGGLWIYDTQGQTLEQIDDAKLPSPIVLTLSEARGRIWIGTQGGLASCTHDQGDWRAWTKDDVLAYNVVSAVTGDPDYLWVGTMGGGFSRLSGLGTMSRRSPEE